MHGEGENVTNFPVLKQFEEKLKQKLEAAFNSISLIERITFLQFRTIKTYEIVRSDVRCTKGHPCLIADVQLTLNSVGLMNNGMSIGESTNIGLKIAQKATLEVLKEFATSTRYRRAAGDELSNPIVEFSSPITPIGDNPAIYVLTAGCLLGTIGAVVYYFRTHLKIFHQSQKVVWKHGSGIMARVKVVKDCSLLTLGIIAIVAESLSCHDYIVGKRERVN